MIDTVKSLDVQLFLFLNGLHNSFFDFLMYWISNRWIWIPLYVYLLFIVIKNYRSEAIMVCLLAAVMLTVSDQLASSVFKNLVMRLRPCHESSIASQVHLVNNHCGGMYGFVSSHATNVFAVLTFFSLYLSKNFRSLKYFLLAWAVINAYSRIYLGVHYPGDVLGGAVLGIILGYFFATIFIMFIRPQLNRTKFDNEIL